MKLFAEDLKSIPDKELYDVAIQAQAILLEKRTAHKAELEDHAEVGSIKYIASVNEVNTLRKGLNSLRLFSEAL